MASLEQKIFKKGSTTYYFSSRFFPREIRQDVFKLYSFLRVADDYVDSVPQNKKEFRDLQDGWYRAVGDHDFDTVPVPSDTLNERVVKNIIQISRRHQFNPDWVELFLNTMASDLKKQSFSTIDDTLEYMHGSSEVVGLMMAKIMDLSAASFEYAKLQGRAMQYLNFIRDLKEDADMGRRYLPLEDLKKFGLRDLKETTARKNPVAFKEFIHYELDRYKEWQKEANNGYKYIPKRLKKPLKTANFLYLWTAKQIEDEPLVVFRKKVKPSISRLILLFSRKRIKL